MKRLVLIVFACMFSAFAIASERPSLTLVKATHAAVHKHKAHKAGKHKAPKHHHHSV